ncbi:hypothetical protein ANO11243_093110 [Dothideomycetidae sp. 11243]|nr:hypothetical protein ANO11243_093110 [fungal sp. No.11243]
MGVKPAFPLILAASGLAQAYTTTSRSVCSTASPQATACHSTTNSYNTFYTTLTNSTVYAGVATVTEPAATVYTSTSTVYSTKGASAAPVAAASSAQAVAVPPPSTAKTTTAAAAPTAQSTVKASFGRLGRRAAAVVSSAASICNIVQCEVDVVLYTESIATLPASTIHITPTTYAISTTTVLSPSSIPTTSAIAVIPAAASSARAITAAAPATTAAPAKASIITTTISSTVYFLVPSAPATTVPYDGENFFCAQILPTATPIAAMAAKAAA